MTGGRLTVVGLGPGDPAHRTPAVQSCLDAATDLVGYGPYLALVAPGGDQRRHPSGNREEAERARFALDLAADGRHVVVVSSGDPGVFAMATAVVEELAGRPERWRGVEVTVLPGVTAATAAAARIGAPLGHDFCMISLSDVLKPWPVVERRLEAAASADFVLALYNPISRQRPWQLGRAIEIIRGHRSALTPVVVAAAVGREGERVRATSLGAFAPEEADMSTVLLVGSSSTRHFVDADGQDWVYTPRHHAAP